MKRLLLAASIALLLSPAAAFAAPAWQDHGHGHGHDQRQSHHDDRYDRRDSHDRRVVVRRPVIIRHDVIVRHDNGRHLGWARQSFRRGQRVPVVYLQPRYYVTDYRGYGLAPPPYGYRWVRPYNDSGEYLLVQVATGLIAQVLGY